MKSGALSIIGAGLILIIMMSIIGFGGEELLGPETVKSHDQSYEFKFSEIQEKAPYAIGFGVLVVVVGIIVLILSATVFSEDRKVNRPLLKKALKTLHGKWGVAIAVTLVYNIIVHGSNWYGDGIPLFSGLHGLASLILGGALTLGFSTFLLAYVRNRKPKFAQLFQSFGRFWMVLGTFLLLIIRIILWTLLLIVPGIIAILRYAFVFYLLADKKASGTKDAFEKSKTLMNGNKKRLFALYLEFLGWFVLSIITVGIGFIWTAPYWHTTFTHFYEEITASTRKKKVA